MCVRAVVCACVHIAAVAGQERFTHLGAGVPTFLNLLLADRGNAYVLIPSEEPALLKAVLGRERWGEKSPWEKEKSRVSRDAPSSTTLGCLGARIAFSYMSAKSLAVAIFDL